MVVSKSTWAQIFYASDGNTKLLPLADSHLWASWLTRHYEAQYSRRVAAPALSMDSCAFSLAPQILRNPTSSWNTSGISHPYSFKQDLIYLKVFSALPKAYNIGLAVTSSSLSLGDSEIPNAWTRFKPASWLNPTVFRKALYLLGLLWIYIP